MTNNTINNSLQNLHADDKQQQIVEIVEIFDKNVKGKEICSDNQNKKHCGKEGHWLETQMEIKHNSKNEPDIHGYEMKKSSTKTTLGDFSASEYAFSKKINEIVLINTIIGLMTIN